VSMTLHVKLRSRFAGLRRPVSCREGNMLCRGLQVPEILLRHTCVDNFACEAMLMTRGSTKAC
jgi:hypothetical protein